MTYYSAFSAVTVIRRSIKELRESITTIITVEGQRYEEKDSHPVTTMIGNVVNMSRIRRCWSVSEGRDSIAPTRVVRKRMKTVIAARPVRLFITFNLILAHDHLGWEIVLDDFEDDFHPNLPSLQFQ